MYEAVVTRFNSETLAREVIDRCGHTHRDLIQADTCVSRLADKRKAEAQVYDAVTVASITGEPLGEQELAQLSARYKPTTPNDAV
jgi:hypothetical protein